MIPGIPGQRLPPPRPKATSKPDAEVPESVFQALHDVSTAVRELGQTVAIGQEKSDAKFATLTKDVADLKASSRTEWYKLVGIALPAVLAIVGGQKVLADKPPAPQVSVVRSADDLRLDECRPLQPGSYERAECFERVSGVVRGRH